MSATVHLSVVRKSVAFQRKKVWCVLAEFIEDDNRVQVWLGRPNHHKPTVNGQLRRWKKALKEIV